MSAKNVNVSFPELSTTEGQKEGAALVKSWTRWKEALIQALISHHAGAAWSAPAVPAILKKYSSELSAVKKSAAPSEFIDGASLFFGRWAAAYGDNCESAAKLCHRTFKRACPGWWTPNARVAEGIFAESGKYWERVSGKQPYYVFNKLAAEEDAAKAESVEAVEAVKPEETKAPEVETAPVEAAPEVAEVAETPVLSDREEAFKFAKNKEAFTAAMNAYATGVLKTPDGILDYGRKMAFMGRYTMRNIALCAFQLRFSGRTPEMIRPFSWWKDHGAMVKKGEHALLIRVPRFAKVELEAVEVSEDAPSTVESEELVGFGFGRVFDLCQIDPETLEGVKAEMPSFSYGIDAGTCDAEALWNLILKSDKRVKIGSGAAAGFTNGEVIAVSNFSTAAAAVHTWAHECGHIGCGHFGPSRPEQGQRELEAEATAMLVCAALGIDASEHAAAYAASWTGANLKPEDAAKALSLAEKVARQILGQLSAWGWNVPGAEKSPAKAPEVKAPAKPKAKPAAKRGKAAAVAVAAEALPLPSDGVEVKRLVMRLRQQKRAEEARDLLQRAFAAKLISKGSLEFQLSHL